MVGFSLRLELSLCDKYCVLRVCETADVWLASPRTVNKVFIYINDVFIKPVMNDIAETTCTSKRSDLDVEWNTHVAGCGRRAVSEPAAA